MNLRKRSTTTTTTIMQDAGEGPESKTTKELPREEEEIAMEREEIAIDDSSDNDKSDQKEANSPDIVPDHHSVPTNTPPTQPSQAVTWAPMDQELAHEKIRDQRRLLKKQHRAIKFLKNEVSTLKRKLQEYEEAAEAAAQNNVNPFMDHPNNFDPQQDMGIRRQFSGGEHQQQQQHQDNDNMMSRGAHRRQYSSGDHHPAKKPKLCTPMDDGSNCNSQGQMSAPSGLVTMDDSQDPIPLQVQPDPCSPDPAFFNNNPQPQQPQPPPRRSSTHSEEIPNTYRVRNQPLVDPYGDKGNYSGSISKISGLPHGRGRMVYDDQQRIYKGGWNNGRWHGVGQAIFANGDTYHGDYHLDQRHGTGRYAWVDGRVYEGDFKADKRQGRGIFRWPDGARYEGDFVNGFRDGHGTYVFCGGCKYTGEWKDGRYNGVGTCLWTNGRCYQGEWRHGVRQGKGVETEEDGTLRHDGQWCDDEPIVPGEQDNQPILPDEADQKMAAQTKHQKRRVSTNSNETNPGRSQGWMRKQSNDREGNSKNQNIAMV